jgi:hypothetical protein
MWHFTPEERNRAWELLYQEYQAAKSEDSQGEQKVVLMTSTTLGPHHILLLSYAVVYNCCSYET